MSGAFWLVPVGKSSAGEREARQIGPGRAGQLEHLAAALELGEVPAAAAHADDRVGEVAPDAEDHLLVDLAPVRRRAVERPARAGARWPRRAPARAQAWSITSAGVTGTWGVIALVGIIPVGQKLTIELRVGRERMRQRARAARGHRGWVRPEGIWIIAPGSARVPPVTPAAGRRGTWPAGRWGDGPRTPPRSRGRAPLRAQQRPAPGRPRRRRSAAAATIARTRTARGSSWLTW